MEQINIRIAKITHRRLNLAKGKIGLLDLNGAAPTLDDVINAGLDLLEMQEARKPSARRITDTPVMAEG